MTTATHTHQSCSFEVNPRRVLIVLLVMIAGLSAANIGIQVLRFGFGHDTILGLIPRLDFGGGLNFPSWYSSAQLALAASIVTWIAALKSGTRDRQRSMWVILALGFWFLSLDEAIALHKAWAPGGIAFDPTAGVFAYRWVQVGWLVVAAVAAMFSPFLASLPKSTRNAFIRAGLLYVGSALGIEMIQGLYHATYQADGFTFAMITMAEEVGEMLSIALFIAALLRYAQECAPSPRAGMLRVSMGPGTALSPNVLGRALIAIVLALFLIAAALHILRFRMGHDFVFGLVSLMDLAREGSLPSWYASIQLAAAGAVLVIIASMSIRARAKYAVAWSVLTLGFFYMSLDELTSIHEAWGRFATFVPATGVFLFRWTVVGLMLCAVLGVFFLGLLRSLSARTRNGTILSAGVFLGGALGLEMLSSYVSDVPSRNAETYALINLFENGFELLGIALFISVMLRYVVDEVLPGRQAAAVGRPLPVRAHAAEWPQWKST